MLNFRAKDSNPELEAVQVEVLGVAHAQAHGQTHAKAHAHARAQLLLRGRLKSEPVHPNLAIAIFIFILF